MSTDENRADLYLPMFVAGRDFADDAVDSLIERSGALLDRSVLVDATALRSGTSSFAAELVHRVLVDGKATELVVVGAPEQFGDYLREAAKHAQASGALKTTRRFPVPVER